MQVVRICGRYGKNRLEMKCISCGMYAFLKKWMERNYKNNNKIVLAVYTLDTPGRWMHLLMNR